MRRQRLIGTGVAAVVVLAAAAALAQPHTEHTPATRSTRAPRRPVATSPAPVSAKSVATLDHQAEHAVANDQQILARCGDIMLELQAVKIRVLRKPRNP